MEDITTQHAISLAILNEKIKTLEDDLDDTKSKLAALERDRDSALKWGIMLLGTTLVSLLGWIFQHYEGVLK